MGLSQIWDFILFHKKAFLLGLVVIGLIIIYPSLFKVFYESGRDFGRSLVSAFLS